MRKSCLVQLIVLVLVGLVLGLVIHHWLGPSSERTFGRVAQKDSDDAKSRRDLVSVQTTLVSQELGRPTPEPTKSRPTGIEGLELETSRPLFVKEVVVRGLVVKAGRLWLACARPDLGQAMLYQLERASGTIIQARRLDTDGYDRISGLISGDGLVWLGLNRDESDSSLILGLDPDSLETRLGLVVPARVRIVVPLGSRGDPDLFRLLTVDEPSNALQIWDSQGRHVSSHRLASGASYWDGVFVDGRLVLIGADAEGGVIDVYDPESTSLLLRHRATIRSDNDRLVADGGLGLDGQTLWFAHSTEGWPLITVYRAASGDLLDWLTGPLP